MSGSSSNFSAFLHANWSNTPYASFPPLPAYPPQVNQYPQLRQHRQKSYRTMEGDMQHDDVDRGSPRALASHNHISMGETGGPAVATGLPPVSTFEDIFGADGYNMSQWRDFSTNHSTMSVRNMDSARTDFLEPAQNFTNAHDFSPPTPFEARSYASSSMSSHLSSVGNATDRQLTKIDNGTSTIVGLPDRIVDVDEFDTIPDSVWPYEMRAMPSLTNTNRSPSSTHSHNSGPYTPASPEDDDYFPSLGIHSFQSIQAVAKIDSGNAFMPRAQLQHFLPPMTQLSTQHAQGLPAWSTMAAPEYAGTILSGPFVELHTAQNSSLPDTGSLQDVEGQALATTEDTTDDSDEEDSESAPDVNDTAINEATHRRARDRYLLSRREEGYSYREIKRMGKFREAESTLRGRVRVLTKHKSERVRRPEWNQRDVDLLQSAVDHYVEFEPQSSAKQRNAELRGRVPWKKISEWMRKRGSSYLFAPATCAKKWKDVNAKK